MTTMKHFMAEFRLYVRFGFTMTGTNQSNIHHSIARAIDDQSILLIFVNAS